MSKLATSKTESLERGRIVAQTKDGRTVQITYEQWLLAEHLKELGIETDYEYHFWELRDWRLDLYAPALRVGFEVHGGQFHKGHRTGFWGKKEGQRRRKLGVKETPQEEEYIKLNAATIDGMCILQFTNEQVNDGRAKAFVQERLAQLLATHKVFWKCLACGWANPECETACQRCLRVREGKSNQ